MQILQQDHIGGAKLNRMAFLTWPSHGPRASSDIKHIFFYSPKSMTDIQIKVVFDCLRSSLAPPDNCGVSIQATRIVGGQDAKLGQVTFPHFWSLFLLSLSHIYIIYIISSRYIVCDFSTHGWWTLATNTDRIRSCCTSAEGHLSVVGASAHRHHHHRHVHHHLHDHHHRHYHHCHH